MLLLLCCSAAWRLCRGPCSVAAPLLVVVAVVDVVVVDVVVLDAVVAFALRGFRVIGEKASRLCSPLLRDAISGVSA